MSSFQDSKQDEVLPGHTLGVVDTPLACESVILALNEAGYPNSSIRVFYGTEGCEAFERRMEGWTWGESAEDCMKQCLAELWDGHCVLCIETNSRQEAARVAAIAGQFGVQNVYHFGLLVDTRLTE